MSDIMLSFIVSILLIMCLMMHVIMSNSKVIGESVLDLINKCNRIERIIENE